MSRHRHRRRKRSRSSAALRGSRMHAAKQGACPSLAKPLAPQTRQTQSRRRQGNGPLWKKPEKRENRDDSMPIIRLDGVSKPSGATRTKTLWRWQAFQWTSGAASMFRSRALQDAGNRHFCRAPRDTNVRSLLAQWPTHRPTEPCRPGAGPQPRRWPGLSELQPDRRYERVRERRISPDTARCLLPNAPAGSARRSSRSA